MGNKLLLNKSPVWILFGIITAFVIFTTSILTYLSWLNIKKEHLLGLKHINRIVMQSELSTFHHQESLLKILGKNLLNQNVEKNPENGRAVIEEMMNINKGMSGFGLARNDGQLIIVSKIPKGEKLPNLTANKQSKDSFLNALNSQSMQIGQTYYMKELKKWVIPIRARIVDDNGNIPLVMTAGLKIDGGETSWNAFNINEGIVVQIVRKDGFTQFQNPIQKSKYQSIYRTRLTQKFLDQIFMLKIPNKTSIALDPLYDNEQNKMMSIIGYIDDYGLYTIVSTPYSMINKHIKSQILKNISIILIITLFLFLLFKTINKIQIITQENYKYLATHDILTKLPNRLLLSKEIDKRIERKKSFYLIYIDLDNFNHVNNTYGHTFGDNLLKKVSMKLKKLLEKKSFMSRQSGDEFIILYEGDCKDKVILFLKKIFDSFSLPFIINNTEIFIGTSMGISKYPQDGNNAEILLSKSDTALYKAKIDKGTFLFFKDNMKKNSKKTLLIESELRQAIQRDEIFIMYQPKIDTVTKKIVGVEALIRWHNRKLGIVPPLDFISIAEKSGLIREISLFVLEQATKEIKRVWHKTDTNFKLSINLSAHQLSNDTSLEKFLQIIERNDFPANKLIFEITESVLIEDINGTIELLEEFKVKGIGLSLDDFGTGFSSLSILSKLPINELKIDKSFIQDITTNPENLSLTKSIIDIGKNMNINTVAEGVESPFELEILQKLECTIIQGYYYSRPLRENALIEFITEGDYLKK